MNPLYELVPLTEKPQKTGRYTLVNENIPGVDNYLFDEGDWWFVTNNITERVRIEFTHWLRPIDPETLKARIREELEKAYDKGFAECMESDSPDRETYINSVIDKLFKQ